MIVPARKNRTKRFVFAGVIVVLVGCLVYGGWNVWGWYHTTHNPHPTVTTKVITYSTSTPDETKPTAACASYRVTANYPKRIQIPRLGVDGCIVQVGVDQNGAIAVPNNIYTAAWYVKSVLPGQPGLSIIDGHISGYYNQDAIFQHLDRLRAGDTFSVTLGSGQVLQYQVTKEQSVPLASAVSVLLAKDPAITSQLNLITCGGHYNKQTKLYDHRIIVSAKLLL